MYQPKIGYFILLCSVKLTVMVELLFQLCIYLVPEQIFAVVGKYLFAYDKNNKIVDVSLGIPPHIINITNSFKIFTKLDDQNNAFNIEKFCQLYESVINYDHCILMISYNHDNQLKYKFINTHTKKLIDIDHVKYPPFSYPHENGDYNRMSDERKLLYNLCSFN